MFIWKGIALICIVLMVFDDLHYVRGNSISMHTYCSNFLKGESLHLNKSLNGLRLFLKNLSARQTKEHFNASDAKYNT